MEKAILQYRKKTGPHCKRDLFQQVQRPLMKSKGFWQNPDKAFEPGGSMEKAILQYRKKTGQPLLTSCFRIIPPRVLKDDTQNLVRSITERTRVLLRVAEEAWPVIKDGKKSAAAKMAELSGLVQEG